MKTFISAVFTYFILIPVASQAQSRSSTYLFGQYNRTLYDYTKGNNLSSYGLGLQTFFHNKTPFKPTVELTGDFIYLDDKVLRISTNGAATPTVTGVVTLFGGIAFHPVKSLYFSLLAGPAYVTKRLLPGIKPSVGFYFLKNQRALLKLSYINIFNRYKPTGDDFGSVSFAFGVKIF